MHVFEQANTTNHKLQDHRCFNLPACYSQFTQTEQSNQYVDNHEIQSVSPHIPQIQNQYEPMVHSELNVDIIDQHPNFQHNIIFNMDSLTVEQLEILLQSLNE